jgi:phage tail-like protein
MAEQPTYPFVAFNFSVEIKVEGVSNEPICKAAFSECDGLEMTMDVKSIREGGNNNREIHLAGPLSYSELSLRRGMTSNFDLWNWFNAVVQDPMLRADASIVVLAADGKTEHARFELLRCLPLKLKAPSLGAVEGAIAIEEFQLGYEHMKIKPPASAEEQEASSS